MEELTGGNYLVGAEEETIDSRIFGGSIDESDEALDETNAAVPSDSADDAQIGSNYSLELSSD
jgi:hypothetical protein